MSYLGNVGSLEGRTPSYDSRACFVYASYLVSLILFLSTFVKRIEDCAYYGHHRYMYKDTASRARAKFVMQDPSSMLEGVDSTKTGECKTTVAGKESGQSPTAGRLGDCRS